jgi:glycine cleavage system regulatory protein
MASAQLLLPPGLELAELQSDLEQIASDLMVGLTLDHGR